MQLAEIWRYAVKSMAGERLAQAELDSGGIAGDRLVQVWQRAVLPDGSTGERIVTARSRPQLLAHRATLGGDGEPLVDGRPWASEAVARDVERAAGAGARLERSDDVRFRFDILPLLVMTDGAIAAIASDPALDGLGVERRRFRPNLVVSGVDGFDERAWEGRRLRIGEVVIALADLRGRCVMTTFDPVTGSQSIEVLRTIARTSRGVLGLNAEVVRRGRVREGDRVQLI